MKDSVGVGGEAADVRPGRSLAANQPGNGLLGRVPHRRDSAGSGTAGERAGGADRQGNRGIC